MKSLDTLFTLYIVCLYTYYTTLRVHTILYTTDRLEL